MTMITVTAPAKINLTLDVLGIRPDGYHEITSVMTQIDLCDTVALSRTEAGISGSTDLAGLPMDESNLAYRAARCVIERFSIPAGVDISIRKRIPMGAGLAGGSTDAAAVIKGMNRLFQLEMNDAIMDEIGASIGSDVPFCLHGPAALATGRGEQLRPIQVKKSFDLVLINPGYAVSTRQVYEAVDRQCIVAHPDNRVMTEALAAGDIEGMAASLGNVLELATLAMHPDIVKIKEALIAWGALGALMSGSGPTVFGIFADAARARAAADRAAAQYDFAVCTTSWMGEV